MTGLAPASPPEVVRLRHGERVALPIGPVAKRIGEDVLRMLAYGGSIPGPVLDVDQGSEIVVDVTNHGDTEATVHWHGLRLENRYDGVPHETQLPIPVGESFSYTLQFPDPGFYCYHPHVREDYGLEMGLYGTILVEPTDPAYWPPADRQLSITLDDVLIEDGRIAPFSRSQLSFTAMGRFGNVMLTNGETSFSSQVATGEVVRLCLVNTANTRTFNVRLPGVRMKLVGGDSGRYEHETFVDDVLLAPSERSWTCSSTHRETCRCSTAPPSGSTSSAASPSRGPRPATPLASSMSCARILSSPPSAHPWCTTWTGRRTRSWRSPR